MKRRFERFWQAFERVPDLAAVPAEWRALLGDDYSAAGRFLLPTPRVAGSVRSLALGRACVHEIRRWRGRFVSVCPEGCPAAELARDEVTVHRLDIATLARQVAESLGLEAAGAEPVPGVAGVWHVGDYVPYCGFRFPAYLTLAGEPESLHSAAAGLAARGRPFVLLAPTRSAFTRGAADVIRQAKACVLPLDELLGCGDDGRLALLDGLDAEGVLAEFRAAHVPQPKADDGMVFFPTPAADADLCDLAADVRRVVATLSAQAQEWCRIVGEEGLEAAARRLGLSGRPGRRLRARVRAAFTAAGPTAYRPQKSAPKRTVFRRRVVDTQHELKARPTGKDAYD